MSGILSGLVGSFKSTVAVLIGWITTQTSATIGLNGVTSTTTDSSGNIYTVTSSAAMNGATGSRGLAIAKYNSSGIVQWQTNWTRGAFYMQSGITVDPTNTYIYVVASLLPSGAGTNYSGFILKFDIATGTLQANTQLTSGISNSISAIWGVVCDSAGNVYVAGRGGIGALTVSGSYVAKYPSTLTSRTWGYLSTTSSISDAFFGIAIDSSSNVYAVGVDATGPLVAKFDTNGTLIWQRNISATGVAWGITIDSSANIYVVGGPGSAAMNPGPIPSGAGSAWIVKYSTGTNPPTIAWSRSLTDSTSSNSCIFTSVKIDPTSTYVYASGQMLGTSGVIAKYNTSGVIQWQRSLTDVTTGNNIAYCINSDSSNIYVGGLTESTAANGTIKAYITKLPVDGTSTGIGQNVIYDTAAATNTDSAGGYTDSAGAGTSAAITSLIAGVGTSNIGASSLTMTNSNFAASTLKVVNTTNATLFSDATYYYAAYKTAGTFTADFVVSGGSLIADILVVAAGGPGGGYNATNGTGGGGGAGGIVYLTSQSVSGSSDVTVGSSAYFTQGGNSQFGTLTSAIGGGVGGSPNSTTLAGSGGSGAGGGTGSAGSAPAGAGTAGQGNAGGAGTTALASGSTGGGGGGFSGVGASAASGGTGGTGSTSASPFYSLVLAVGINSGLIGGGGANSVGTASAGGGAKVAGIANTGGGGGGGFSVATTNGLLGGTGMIIIRYTRSQIVGG